MEFVYVRWVELLSYGRRVRSCPKRSVMNCFRVCRPWLCPSSPYMAGDELSHLPERDFDPQTRSRLPPEHVASISTSLPSLPPPPTSILPLSWWVRRASSLSFLVLASAGFPTLIRSILHSCIATDHFRSDRELPIGQVGLPIQPAGKDRSGFIRRAVHAQCVSQLLSYPPPKLVMYVDHLYPPSHHHSLVEIKRLRVQRGQSQVPDSYLLRTYIFVHIRGCRSRSSLLLTHRSTIDCSRRRGCCLT